MLNRQASKMRICLIVLGLILVASSVGFASDSGERILRIEGGAQLRLGDDDLVIFIANYPHWELPGLVERDLADAVQAAFPDNKIHVLVWDAPFRDDDFVASGIAPDIFISTAHNYIDRMLKGHDWEYDMTDLIAEHEIDLTELNYGAVEMVKSRSNGLIYGVPLFIREYVMFYNKLIFDAFEAEYPTNGMTYDEIYDIVSQYKVNGQLGVRMIKGFEVHPDHYLNMNQLGAYFFEDTGTAFPDLTQIRDSVNLDTPEFLHIIENMYRFIAVFGNIFNAPQDFYRIGNHAMVVDTIDNLYQYNLSEYHIKKSDISNYEKWSDKVDFGVASVPVFVEAPNITYQPNLFSASVTNQSENKDLAMEVIKWLVSEEGQMNFSVNGHKAVLETDAIVDAFASNIPAVAHIEGLGEAVYWGENAAVKNYTNTNYVDGFPHWMIFRQFIRQEGLPPELAIQKFMYDEANGYKSWYKFP